MIVWFAFFAGVLSVLAPCVLPMLPVLLWTWLAKEGKNSAYRILVSSLFFIFIFTFTLKLGASVLPLSPEFLTWISTIIIIGYGILLIFPSIRDHLKMQFPSKKTNTIKKEKKADFRTDVLLGASLGPLFTSCSPTYALIISAILPTNFLIGILSIFAYILGFWLVIFIVIFFGKEAIQKLNRYANPNGIFKKAIGIILILTGILIISGGFKYLESKLVELNISSSLIKIEHNAIKNLK